MLFVNGIGINLLQNKKSRVFRMPVKEEGRGEERGEEKKGGGREEIQGTKVGGRMMEREGKGRKGEEIE